MYTLEQCSATELHPHTLKKKIRRAGSCLIGIELFWGQISVCFALLFSVFNIKEKWMTFISFLGFYFFLLLLMMCRGVCLYVDMCAWGQVPEEARGLCFPGAGVAESCEPPDLGAGNQTQILRKAANTQPLGHLSSLQSRLLEFFIYKYKLVETLR